MKICVFCGITSATKKINKEHVFRKKNRSIFGRNDTHTSFMRFSKKSGVLTAEKPKSYNASPYEQQVGSVCESCNSGWLNKIDSEFENLQFRLVKNLNVFGCKSDAELIYTWAYKTALIRTLVDESCERAISQHHMKNLYETKKPDLNVGVWVFNSNEPIDLYSRHSFGIANVNENGIEYNQVTIAMGCMGIYVIMLGPNEKLLSPMIVEDEILTLTGGNAKRMWPESVNFIWPISMNKISDEAISNIAISLTRALDSVDPAETIASHLYISRMNGSDRK